MASESLLRRARERWSALWESLGAEPPAACFDRLVAAYGDPGRHYHCFEHVWDCLEVLDRCCDLAQAPHEVEMALWFHDAVYDPRRGDNEAASADWAVSALREAGVARECAERIRRMILATRHDVSPETADEALLLDIDLSILGRAPDEFHAYERAVRREFDWVPEDVFRRARAALLQAFLNRPAIYVTAELRARYERRARDNLRSALRRCAELG